MLSRVSLNSLRRAGAASRAAPAATRAFATKKKAAKKAKAAAPAAAADDVKLPVTLFGLPAKYANSLYKAAVKSNQLAAVEADMEGLAEQLRTTPALKEYIHNPIISRKDKMDDMKKIGAGMNDLSSAMLCVLAEQGSLAELEKVVSTFGTLMNAQKGLVEVTVTSAQPLSKGQLSQVESSIADRFLTAGQSIKLATKVDEGILGGLQVQIGDRYMDLSVQSHLNKMHKKIQAQM